MNVIFEGSSYDYEKLPERYHGCEVSLPVEMLYLATDMIYLVNTIRLAADSYCQRYPNGFSFEYERCWPHRPQVDYSIIVNYVLNAYFNTRSAINSTHYALQKAQMTQISDRHWVVHICEPPHDFDPETSVNNRTNKIELFDKDDTRIVSKRSKPNETSSSKTGCISRKKQRKTSNGLPVAASEEELADIENNKKGKKRTSEKRQSRVSNAPRRSKRLNC